MDTVSVHYFFRFLRSTFSFINVFLLINLLILYVLCEQVLFTLQSYFVGDPDVNCFCQVLLLVDLQQKLSVSARKRKTAVRITSLPRTRTKSSLSQTLGSRGLPSRRRPSGGRERSTVHSTP